MALLAKLQFGDNVSGRYSKEYLVTDFKFHLSRRHNEVRPDGSPQCENMELTVVVPGREDLNLTEWYLDGTSMSGRILVELTASVANQSLQWKEVQFENGLCYAMAEDYHIDVRTRRTLQLSIAVQEITIDSVNFKSVL